MPSSKQDHEAARRRVEAIQKVDPIPEGELQKFFAARKAEAARRFQKRKDSFEQQSRLTSAIMAPYRELISPEQREKSLEAFKEQRKLWGGIRKLRHPKPGKADPRITAGSILSIFVPPFTATPLVTNGGGAVGGLTDGTTGFEELYVSPAQPAGGSSSAQTGMFAVYSPISDMPWGLFRPFIRYGYHYDDQSWSGYVAHSTGTITVSVFDTTSANSFLPSLPVGQDVRSVWQDGTGGFEHHNLSVPPDEATISDVQYLGFVQVPFPLIGGHRYMLLVELGATADDKGEDLLGASSAVAQLQTLTTLMVVEETHAP